MFRCLFCCSLEEYRVIHGRPYEGCYLIPNNEVVDSFIVAAIITSQLIGVYAYCCHLTSISQFSTKEQKLGTGILYKLKPGALVEYNK